MTSASPTASTAPAGCANDAAAAGDTTGDGAAWQRIAAMVVTHHSAAVIGAWPEADLCALTDAFEDPIDDFIAAARKRRDAGS